MKSRRDTKVTITLTQQEAAWLSALLGGVTWDDDKKDEPITQFIVQLSSAVDLVEDCWDPFFEYFTGERVSIK